MIASRSATGNRDQHHRHTNTPGGSCQRHSPGQVWVCTAAVTTGPALLAGDARSAGSLGAIRVCGLIGARQQVPLHAHQAVAPARLRGVQVRAELVA